MTEGGLMEVMNPSAFMLEGRPEGESGSVVTCTMEGTRPILSEVQALVTRHDYETPPRRTATGTDYNRLNLLLAVLEKRLGVPLGRYDAYVNIVGGMKIAEPSVDLALVMAIISSYQDIVLGAHTIAFGEVGLSGEVRSVSMAQQRVEEAARLGFTTCFLPKVNLNRLKIPAGMKVYGISSVRELFRSKQG